MAGWYQKFIPHYADICEPLYRLKKKGAKFNCPTEAQDAFNKVKRALTEAPVLQLPNFEEQFNLFTDASGNPVGNMDGSQISCAALRALALNSRKQLIREQREGPELGHIYRYLENPVDGSVNATWSELIPLRKASAQAIANALFENCISRYGAPISLISDNGPQFISEVFEHLRHRLDIKHIKTVTYRPQANLTERVNRTLVQMIACFEEENHDNWDRDFSISSLLSCAHQLMKRQRSSNGSSRSHPGKSKRSRKTSSEESKGHKLNKGNAGLEDPRLKRKVRSNGSVERTDKKRSKICRKRSLQGSEHGDQKRPTPVPTQGIKRTAPSSISSGKNKYNNPSQGVHLINPSRQGKSPVQGPGPTKETVAGRPLHRKNYCNEANHGRMFKIRWIRANRGQRKNQDFVPDIESEKYNDIPNLDYQEMSEKEYLKNVRSRSTKTPFIENTNNLLKKKKSSEENTKRNTYKKDTLQKHREFRQENIHPEHSVIATFKVHFNELSVENSNQKDNNGIALKTNSLEKRHKNSLPLHLKNIIISGETNHLNRGETKVDKAKRIMSHLNSLQNRHFGEHKNIQPFRRQTLYNNDRNLYKFHQMRNPTNLQNNENELRQDFENELRLNDGNEWRNIETKSEAIKTNDFSNRKKIKPALHDRYNFKKPALKDIKLRLTDNEFEYPNGEEKRDSVDQLLYQPKDMNLKRKIIDKINYFEIDDLEKGIELKDPVKKDKQKIPLDGALEADSGYRYLQNFRNVSTAPSVTKILDRNYTTKTESTLAISNDQKKVHARVVEVYQEPFISDNNRTSKSIGTDDMINNSEKKRKDLEGLLRALTDDLGEEKSFKSPANEETEIRILIRKIIRQDDTESEKNRSAYFGSVTRWKDDPSQQKQSRSATIETINLNLTTPPTSYIATIIANALEAKDGWKIKRMIKSPSRFLPEPGKKIVASKIIKRSRADNLDNSKFADNYSGHQAYINKKIKDLRQLYSKNFSNKKNFGINANDSEVSDIKEEPIPNTNWSHINKVQQILLNEMKRLQLTSKPEPYKSPVADTLELKREQTEANILPGQPPDKSSTGITKHFLTFLNENLPMDNTDEQSIVTENHVLPKILETENIASTSSSGNDIVLQTEKSNAVGVFEFPQIKDTPDYSKEETLLPKNIIEWELGNVLLKNKSNSQRMNISNIRVHEPKILELMNAVLTSNKIDENIEGKYLKSQISNNESISTKLIPFEDRNEFSNIESSSEFSHTTARNVLNEESTLLNLHPYTHKFKEISDLLKNGKNTIGSVSETPQKIISSPDVSNDISRAILEYLNLVTSTIKSASFHKEDYKKKKNVVDILKNLTISKSHPETKNVSTEPTLYLLETPEITSSPNAFHVSKSILEYLNLVTPTLKSASFHKDEEKMKINAVNILKNLTSKSHARSKNVSTEETLYHLKIPKITSSPEVSNDMAKDILEYLHLVTSTTESVSFHKDEEKMKFNAVDIIKNLTSSKSHPGSKNIATEETLYLLETPEITSSPDTLNVSNHILQYLNLVTEIQCSEINAVDILKNLTSSKSHIGSKNVLTEETLYNLKIPEITSTPTVSNDMAKAILKYLHLVTSTIESVSFHKDEEKMKINAVDILKNLSSSKCHSGSKNVSTEKTLYHLKIPEITSTPKVSNDMAKAILEYLHLVTSTIESVSFHKDEEKMKINAVDILKNLSSSKSHLGSENVSTEETLYHLKIPEITSTPKVSNDMAKAILEYLYLVTSTIESVSFNKDEEKMKINAVDILKNLTSSKSHLGSKNVSTEETLYHLKIPEITSTPKVSNDMAKAILEYLHLVTSTIESVSFHKDEEKMKINAVDILKNLSSSKSHLGSENVSTEETLYHLKIPEITSTSKVSNDMAKNLYLVTSTIASGYSQESYLFKKPSRIEKCIN
ncbi:uncharacterized protein TNCV_3039021 [Trichonephila clavipes]|nr:uncharacterized protein TNCV_3039021 [Trichonephila clavipes]